MTPLIAAILLTASAPADISLAFTSPKGLIVVQTEGNGGRNLRVLVDTGAQRTVIDRTVAEAMGLEKGDEVRARGAGGSIDAWWAKGLHLADLGEPPLEAVSVKLDAISKAIGTPIDIILGQDVLAKRVVEIDRVSGKVTFGTRPAIVSSSATVVSLTLRGGRPYVPAMVVMPNGQEREAELLLDTGSDTAAELAQPYADEIGLRTKPDPSGRSILGVGGLVPLRIADLREVRLGRASVPAQDVRVYHRPADSAGDGDGRVGNGFLSRFKATIDGPGLKLVLTPIRKETTSP